MRLDGAARLEIAPGMGPLLEAAGIRDLKDALDPDIGTLVVRSRSSWVRRVPAGTRALYVKCFVYPTAKDVILRIVSRRFLRHRARREWQSIDFQQRLGLPVVARVCLGELRQLGFLRAAVLVTEELAGARRLDEWLRQMAGAEGHADAPAIVARYAALLHRSGFTHGDLNARNVLVRDADGALDLRNVDSARGRPRTWNARLTGNHIRDIAPLALALRAILGPEAEAALIRSYLSETGVALTSRVVRMLGAEIDRIGPKETRRLVGTGFASPTAPGERERAQARADSERSAP